MGRPKRKNERWFTWKQILNIRRIYAVVKNSEIKCPRCGMEGVENFSYKWDGKDEKIRFRCLNCGRLGALKSKFQQKHVWYISPFAHDWRTERVFTAY